MAAGQPRPPRPMIRTRVDLSFCWPVGVSGLGDEGGEEVGVGYRIDRFEAGSTVVHSEGIPRRKALV